MLLASRRRCARARIVSKATAAQLIVRPPLTLTVWPVTKDASSEARNATTLATSSGWPSRRNGIALVRASRSFGPANDANSAVSVGRGRRS